MKEDNLKNIIMRPVQITSNQFQDEGMLHMYIGNRALIELKDGRLCSYELGTIYSIRFTDV